MTRSGLGNSLVFGEGKIYWLWDSLESMRIILFKYKEGSQIVNKLHINAEKYRNTNSTNINKFCTRKMRLHIIFISSKQ